jgi:hypothetical protein
VTAPDSGDPRWATYPDTILEIHVSPPLRVDLRCAVEPLLAQLLRALGLGAAWAFVTAYNPGRILTPEENAQRERELADAVRALGVPSLRADGVPPVAGHREPGVAIALPQEEAVELARRFGQSAIFWFDGQRFWLVPALVGDAPIGLPVLGA